MIIILVAKFMSQSDIVNGTYSDGHRDTDESAQYSPNFPRSLITNEGDAVGPVQFALRSMDSAISVDSGDRNPMSGRMIQEKDSSRKEEERDERDISTYIV